MTEPGRTDDDRERPTTNHPLNAPPRRMLTPTLAVIGLIVVIAIVFLVVTWLRYHT